MLQYVLEYARPRPSLDGIGVIWERQLLRKEFAEHAETIRWALEVVRWEQGITHGGENRYAEPLELRCESTREIVWQRSTSAMEAR